MLRANSAGAGRTSRFGALVAVVGAMWIGGAPAAAAPGDPGTVSGRVVAGDGSPIEGICANVEPGGQGATSQDDGSYEISGVAPGEYTVRFADCRPLPIYLTRWYRDRDAPDQADTVTVPVDAGAVLEDTTLVPGVSVSGTVTGADGTPLEGIDVFVNPYDGPGPSAGARTGADGTYRTIPLPDGDHRVQFDDPDDEYATQFWRGRAAYSEADRLQLGAAAGTERTGVDATLALAASISGTVTDEDGPLAGICVYVNTPASNGGWNGVGSGQTAADGTYTIDAIPPGIDLRVQFFDCTPAPSHVEQWYDGSPDFARSSSVVVTPGEPRSGIDARLTTGIRVAGTVTDGDGDPLEGIDVSVNPDGQGPGGYGRTDASGDYVTSPVLPGRYRVQFRDGTGTWAAEYWDDQPTYGTATILELTAADPQEDDIDARLGAAASISGTVTSTGGGPVGQACIAVVIDSPNGPEFVTSAQADASGAYTVTGLPAITAKVRAEDCTRVGPYSTRWWQAAASYDAATPIPLTAGVTRTGVDVALPPAGTISGRVTDAAGGAIAGICVQATTVDAFGALVTTDADGEYVLLLDGAGDYGIQFVDCRGQPVFAGQTLGPISVQPGVPVTGRDVVLVPGATASISGTVRNGDGVAVTGACVVVYLPNQYALFGQVLADGTYTITGVPSGTYAIAFVGCGDGGGPSAVIPDPVDPTRTYQARWWPGVELSLAGTVDGGPDPIAQGATLVAVPPGGALTGFDQCFGCQPPPTTSTTTTTTTTSSTTTTTSSTTTTRPTTTSARGGTGTLPATGADGSGTVWAAAITTLAGTVILVATRRPSRPRP